MEIATMVFEMNADPRNIKLVLPLGIMNSTITYTPSLCASDPIYKSDSDFFKQRKDRFWTIRKCMGDEFGENGNTFVGDHGIVFAPQLWVHVSRHPNKLGHRVQPVYRGSLPASIAIADGHIACESDEMIQAHLGSMQMHQGFNPYDLAVWQDKYLACMASYQTCQLAAVTPEQVH
jgi:hypothetical protein